MAKVSYARALRADGRYADAVPYYDEGIERRPKLREAYHELGDCYEKLGKENDAIRVYERALKAADPRDEVPLRALARLYEKRGLIDDAIAMLKRLREAAPGDAAAAKDLERLEAWKSPEAVAERERLAKAKAKHDEIKPAAERYFAERRYEETITVIESYPEEYRNTDYWTKSLAPLRDRAEEERKK